MAWLHAVPYWLDEARRQAASARTTDLEAFVDVLVDRLTGPESRDDVAVLALHRTGPDAPTADIVDPNRRSGPIGGPAA